ncbi:hypothetical protein B9Q13_02540 [Candidatus Marsarchaeota G2 archaeon ECH_B_SAG-G16]|jgi:rRNA processing protein Krr1/Pno1|uniref:K Homology domain-containing protein n=6 Tax=Candidatus Marsarchaeota TaxID=1978152 RepID=A0A2R6BZH6_9ARCH|nr:MAG: hypothetical protein B9Q01_01000 [Candidatus Marsarchaeota G1 archaeon OSP_D]PSN89130.1 MAG: hypothetical protein B9Q00_02600 [Candidatus Marsarchaeota G1 archaeon OSP_C]PSN92848.1 MAG: hypothetical protein B9P99_03140 [Candidatus Marsarchaeota G1 archaeon OSP_B]PSO02761.1 MAG: hypothetical protein B9Q10_00990 [Candidatus Marsarchaeota G2 archaeon ECH_B_SAG-E12]PSO04017.1 MAG: hypothetical protein B9Q12_03185 [Candidatus Marsarchaeota G2 archaeon ECH_B_SAG-G06]PSO05207.1 MAG: hypotheti
MNSVKKRTTVVFEPHSGLDAHILSEFERLLLFLKEKGVIINRIGTNLIISAPSEFLMRATECIKLIEYGVPFERARIFFEKEEYYHIIELDKEELSRKIGRIIGTNGKTKRNLEKIIGVSIFVKDNRVIIVGNFDSVERAKDAILRIVKGKPQNIVINRFQRP